MRRTLPLVLSALALTISLLANPGFVAQAAKLINGKQIANNSIPEKKLKAAVRTKLNAVGQPGPAGPAGPAGPTGPAGAPATINGVTAGGVLSGTYPSPGFAAGAVAPDAAKLGGTASSEYQRECAEGVVKARVAITTSSVSTTDYATTGVSDAYMCVGGTVYAKRTADGTVQIAFHLGNTSGQFGAIVGEMAFVNADATGAGYMANVNDGGNPGSPPFGFSSIITYRVRIVDATDQAVNQPVKVVVF